MRAEPGGRSNQSIAEHLNPGRGGLAGGSSSIMSRTVLQGDSMAKNVFVLLLGDEAGNPVDLYQVLLKKQAVSAARAAGSSRASRPSARRSASIYSAS